LFTARDAAAPQNVAMLLLRITCPPALTEQVRALLRDDPTAFNLVVMPGAVEDPSGDLVLADVTRESADALLAQLQALGVDRGGSISVTPVTATLSSTARRAETFAPGHGQDALVWNEVETRVAADAILTVTFLVMLSIATLLGALGALYDNPVLVVGAMVAGPEYGALAAVAVGLARGERWLWRRGAVTLVLGFAAAMALTTVAVLVMDAANVIDLALIDEPGPQTAFVYEPDRRTPLVAILAGIVGMLSLTSANATALIGVLVSATTVPAAGYAVVALAAGDTSLALGSFENLLLNVVGLVVAGVLTLLVKERLWKRYGRPRLRQIQARYRNALSERERRSAGLSTGHPGNGPRPPSATT
jgi:uncharacterized hydrophobic protein (TIGR00271 family)